MGVKNAYLNVRNLFITFFWEKKFSFQIFFSQKMVFRGFGLGSVVRPIIAEPSVRQFGLVVRFGNRTLFGSRSFPTAAKAKAATKTQSFACNNKEDSEGSDHSDHGSICSIPEVPNPSLLTGDATTTSASATRSVPAATDGPSLGANGGPPLGATSANTSTGDTARVTPSVRSMVRDHTITECLFVSARKMLKKAQC
jgi:hypothetical protein